MLIDHILYTINTHPTDEVFSSSWSFSLKVHDPAGTNHHVDPRADRAAGHTRGFMNGDALPEIFLDNELADRRQKRRTIIGVGFDLIRPQFECGLLCRTLAFCTDVDIKPVHSRRP